MYDVGVVVGVVGVVSKVDALTEEAWVGETHIEALAAGIYVLWFGILATVEQKLD